MNQMYFWLMFGLISKKLDQMFFKSSKVADLRYIHICCDVNVFIYYNLLKLQILKLQKPNAM